MKIYVAACFILFFLFQCTTPSRNAEKDPENSVLIEFKSIETQNTSLLKDITFVKLETNDECLIGNINQIEIFDESIYIYYVILDYTSLI
jgi:hypothetical protein